MDWMPRRRFLETLAGAVGALGAARSARGGVAPEPPLRVQRLSWAGVRLEAPGLSLFFDPWSNTGAWDGAWVAPVVPIEASSARRFALISHAHNDHFDAAALEALLGTDRAFAAERPVLIEFHTDPDVPPLPPHITWEQARAYMTALAKGDPDEGGIIRNTLRQALAGILPGHGD